MSRHNPLPKPPPCDTAPSTSSLSCHQRRLVSDESLRIVLQHQEMDKKITDSDTYIFQLLDLLEETRMKWEECEKENARLADLCKTLQKDLEEATSKNENLTDLLNNARVQVSNLSMAKKKVEEDLVKYRRQLQKVLEDLKSRRLEMQNINETSCFSPESSTHDQSEDSGNATILAQMETPKKKTRRSNSAPHHLRRPSSGSSSYSNTLLIFQEKSSSVTASPAALSLHRPPPKMTPATSFENINKIDFRQHSFETRRIFSKNSCYVCSSLIKFGMECSKCSVCKLICHQNCRLRAAIPCVPFFVPPKSTNGRLRLGEYCSDEIVPKLPHLIIRCVQYLNTRTLSKGLYVDLSHGGEAELLLKLILCDRNPANVSKYGPKVAAHCILKFLSSLRESLILESSIPEFSKAANHLDDSLLENEIAELPIVHKNTLAYLFLHWKRLIEESNDLTEEDLGRAVLPAIMRITTSEVSTYLPVFYRLLALSKSYWFSAFDTTLSRASSNKLKGGTPYALTVAKIQEEQDARLGRPGVIN